jgi:integrase
MIDYRDPHGKRIRLAFKKKKDAEAELGKRVSLIAENRYLDVKKEFTTTLSVLTEKYTENFPHPTKKMYCTNFKEYFGEHTLLANIRYVDLETYRNRLRHKPTIYGTVRKESTVNREMSCLHHLFTKAVEWDMIEQSPFSKGKSLLLKENNTRIRFLKEDEIIKLLNSSPKYLRNIIECALNTGMRRGEILSLKWDQIRNGFIYLKETKTKEPRQIPINNTLEALFKNIRKEHGLKSKYVFLYDGQIIETKSGKMRKTKKELQPVKNIKKTFKSALKRAGISDFRFHDLRHTFASQLLMKGGSLKDVQELLGHKTMTMTLRYAHLTQEHKRKAVNLLNELTARNGHTQNKRDSAKKLNPLI